MSILNGIVNIFQTYIVGEPFIFLSIIAMIGLILQKKTIDKIITGSLKTGIGYLILNVGTGTIAGVVLPIATLLNKIIGIQATAPGIGTNAFTEEWAPTIAIIMVIGFFVNLILARFTPLKYVYLTVHQTYYMTFVYLAIAVEVFGVACHSTAAMIIGGLLLGIYCTVAPAIAQPFVRKVTGSDDFAYGHTTTTGVVVGSLVGSIFSKYKDESSEDLKINPKLNFLKDITVSTAVVMTLLYVIATLLAGTGYV
ncbi:MAG: PTS transporter subunit IIC, partial [Erysipelotrichaceae bacterium]|nr:PTS transporter subunit IIC [Erysipelotrichaceae bacterium]